MIRESQKDMESVWLRRAAATINDGLTSTIGNFRRVVTASRASAMPRRRIFGCDLLLLGESTVETVNQNVRVNESGHERTDPLFSSLCPERRNPLIQDLVLTGLKARGFPGTVSSRYTA